MGGYDLFYFFSYCNSATPVPPWVCLITSPLGWLPYPLMWYVWSVISIVIVTACAKVFGARFWWMLPFSGAVMFDLWIGQVEPLVLLGVTLGWLILRQRKLHPAFMGIAWLLMALKPQVAALPMLLFAYWLWKERGKNAIVWAVGVFVWIVALSFALFPAYPRDIMHTMQIYTALNDNASVFPFGLAALPLLAWPGLDRLTRLRVALAVNLLCSPYILLYHTMTLLAVVGNPALMLLSWLTTGMFMYLVSVVPIVYLLGVVYEIVNRHRHVEPSDLSAKVRGIHRSIIRVKAIK